MTEKKNPQKPENIEIWKRQWFSPRILMYRKRQFKHNKKSSDINFDDINFDDNIDIHSQI